MKLPVEEIRDELVSPFPEGQPKRVLLKAPTGSGKSTMIPLMLEQEGRDGLIVVIQPRRIAARMLANRVAHLYGCKVGEEVGYSVRFDQRKSKKTKILFVTDGIFQNWCDQDPTLEEVGTVIFDEFHERRVASDVTLGKCLNLQELERDDLKVVVMSATLEIANLSEFLGECRELEANGRAYPVDIQYKAEQITQRGGGNQRREGIWDRCVQVAKGEIQSPDVGHILIFLPGVFEIKKTVNLLENGGVFKGWKICPLYSALSPQLQDEAVAPSNQPKIIVSTNLAETSLTIEGVRTVIDAGLARVSEFDPNRGIETLLVKAISQAAADQRAGRAGRMAPGKCVRLWSQNSHRNRDAFDRPEIRRTDVAELMLKFSASGDDIREFRWLDAPFTDAVDSAEKDLRFLGAIDEYGTISGLGKVMSLLPLPPRFSRLIMAGSEGDCLAEACFIAAVIQGEGVFTRRSGDTGRADFIYDDDCCDFAGEYRAYEAAERVGFDPKRCGQMGILARGARECKLALKQIHEYADRLGLKLGKVDFNLNATNVVAAGVRAFGDRIGKRHNKNTLASKLSDGRKGMLDGDSCAKHADLFISTEITEVDGKDVVVKFNRCFALSLELLKSHFKNELTEENSAEYDSVQRKVIGKKVTLLRGLRVYEEDGDLDADLASAMLAEKVAKGDLILKEWGKSVDAWIARLLGLREWMPELELPDFSQEDKIIALEQVCAGATSYKEIKNRPVLPAVRSWLSDAQSAGLNAFAPTEITLENGRATKVYYEIGKKPWIALRAQLLFGVKQTPSIANGMMKLNVHICAPNNRPWQITDDLENFWKSGFEQMRKDLGGRYPKHKWEL